MSRKLDVGIATLSIIAAFISIILPALQDVSGVIVFSNLFIIGFLLLAAAIVASIARGR